MDNVITGQLWNELKAEAPSTRNCLARVPERLFDWKPHEKSMKMGYLALLVAEVPRWISIALASGEIDFQTFKHNSPKTTDELVSEFDENMKGVQKALKATSDAQLSEPFYLKSGSTIFLTNTKGEMISQSINHLVHHRGQLTVYLRLNDVPVPSIYGPSADDKNF